MASYTPSLGLELITPGSQAGLWGNTTNNSLNLIDQAITGVTPLSFASASGSTYTLTDFNGAQDESRSAVLNITGTASGGNTVVIPNKQKTYLVRNFTGQDVTFRTATPSATYTVGAGYSILIFCDGNNNVFTGIAAPSVGTLLVNAGGTGNTTFTAGFIKSPGGTSALTSSATVNAGTELSGVTPVSNGGTGQASLTGGALLFGNGTSGIGSFVGSAVGQVATWSGSAWQAVAPSAAGVLSIAGSGINVSPATGNVTITLTSGNVTGALGYTPPSVSGAGATGTWGINISGNANTATSASSASTATTATTASNANSLGGFAANNYPRLATANTFTAVQVASGLGSGVAGFQVTNAGVTTHMTSNSVQVGYSGQGLFTGGAGGIALFVSGCSWTLSGPNAVFAGGDCFKPGGGVWATSSDERLKENIAPLVGALEKIDSLNPVTFDWKYQTSNPNVGFVAQEVQSVLPTAVSLAAPSDEQKQFVGEDSVYSVGWKNDMIAYLVGAIKELKAEVDALKAAK
jgi:hypothetical protein